MKLYKIGDKVYEAKRKSIDSTSCNLCSLYKRGVRQYCPSEELSHKCSRLGWNVYFVEYKGGLDNKEVIELINEKIELKPVYKRIKKGFTRRDVLRELILELKEKLGVDIVRTCDSVDQCKAVIDEIIKIACNCELSSAKDLITRKDTALKVQEDVKHNLYKQLNEKDEEIEKLKSEYDELRAIYQVDLSSYKEEAKRLYAALDNTEQSRVEWVNTAKHNDELYTNEFIECESLKGKLEQMKHDNEILGMWLRAAEDRSVLGLIAFKFKRFINKVMKNV